MYIQRLLAAAAVTIAMTAPISFAQSVTSAHSGTLHYFEGSLSIDGAPVESRVGKFTEIKEKSVLRTGQGRAEILLTPGVFLRVAENSEIKLLDNRLVSTRVEFLSGSAMVEADDPGMSVKDMPVTIVYRDYDIQPMKLGLFELTSDPAQMKVFKGQATVTAGNNRVVVKDGHLLPFSAALLTEKFDERQADDLYLWTRDRSAYISAANLSSARTMSTAGYPSSGFLTGSTGGWYLNPYLNMYTFMPFSGYGFSPFGYGFFSPYSIYSFYNPGNYYWYGGGGARAGGSYLGQPLTSLGISRIASSPVPRLTSGSNLHPTLSSPLAGTSGFAGAYRGGFNGSGTNNTASSRGGFSPAPSSGGFSGGSSAASGGFSGGSIGGGGGHSVGGGGASAGRGR